MGRLLAKTVKASQTSPSISALRALGGKLVNAPTCIMQEMVKFYSDLYKSQVDYSPDDLQDYLQGIELPCLADAQRLLLDAPIKLEELQEALSLFPNSKAPGDDGLPMEIFKQYGGVVLPQLLKVLNSARGSQCLPESMTRASIILKLKLGKDPLVPRSYRPNSLLESDKKILAKVLALGLNRVISSIIFRSFIWLDKPPQVKLEQLQKSKDAGGVWHSLTPGFTT